MNILVTGVGAIIGYGIISSLREIEGIDIRIIGMDIYDDAYGRFICDKFYKAEKANSDSYLDFVNDLVNSEDIDLIIPGIEQDMYRLFELQSKINTLIVLNNPLLVRLSKNKWDTFTFFDKHKDLEIIPTLENVSYESCISELGSPFLMKLKCSYASKGLYIVNNKHEFDFYSQLGDYIYQKIVGTSNEEYTVGIFGDGNGSFFDHIIFRRTLSQEGATAKAELITEDLKIMGYVSKICSITKPIGPTNIQLRKDNGIPLLLEINPRISSSTSLRMSAGYNEAKMCIDYYLLKKEKLEPSVKRSIKAVRYISDFIYE